MTKIKIFVKNRIRKKNEFQFFMHQLVENLSQLGAKPISPQISTFTEKLRFKLTNILLFINFAIPKKHKQKNVIITSRGENLLYESFPFWRDRVIPILWDIWPEYQENLIKTLGILKCDMVFVTVRSFAEQLKDQLKINAFWIPEGIETEAYIKGVTLKERNVEILEMGRQHKKFHNHVENLISKGLVTTWKGQINDQKGNRVSLTCQTNDELYNLMSNSKLFVCFPMCDTHPQKAGRIETLTQRYWEGMLSGCLLIGRAPQELIDFIGYNPVINIEWDNIESQLLTILNNIEQYQDFVDKNYQTAINKASWSERSIFIIEKIKANSFT